MEGRKAGEPGGLAAQRWLETRFAEIGLEPLGDDGTYAQTFEFAIRDLGDCRLSVAADGTTTAAVPRDDFLPLVGSANGRFDAEAVFVGFGITAPECAWDDYEGIDVRGKVAVALRHEPFADDPGASAWDGRRLTRHARFAEKARNAARHGAVALVVVPSLASFPKGAARRSLPGRGFWRSTNPMGKLGALIEDLDDTAEFREHNVSAREMHEQVLWISQAQDSGLRMPIPAVFLAAEASARLLDAGAEERALAGAGAPRSRALPGRRVAGRVEIVGDGRRTANVVGRLRGSDPGRREEHVVVGAHYDHVGMDASTGSVWNGADDNASGTAAILAMAKALAASPPARSIVFVAFAAEEVALLGSFHFAANPPIALESIVAMLNLDMIGRGNEDDLRASPGEASSENQVFVAGSPSSPVLAPLLRRANAGIDLEVTASESMFDRSDQAAFYLAGIPVLFLNTGEHGDYHRETDTTDRLDFAKALRVTRLGAAVAQRLADLPGRPPFVDALRKAEAVAGEPRRSVLFGSTPFLERPDL